MSIKSCSFKIVEVLARVGFLPVEGIQNGVKGCCDKRSEHGVYRVDPMMSWEGMVDNSWAKGSRRVPTGASEVLKRASGQGHEKESRHFCQKKFYVLLIIPPPHQAIVFLMLACVLRSAWFRTAALLRLSRMDWHAR